MTRSFMALVSAVIAGIISYLMIDYYGLGGIFGDPPLNTKLVFAALAGIVSGGLYSMGQKWSWGVMIAAIVMILLCWFMQKMAGIPWFGLLLAAAAVAMVLRLIPVRPVTPSEEPHGRFTGD